MNHRCPRSRSDTNVALDFRTESAGDLRTLTATGATARIRRKLTATTAGALALLGALLGVLGAYVLLAALAGWLLAGREPPAIARQVID